MKQILKRLLITVFAPIWVPTIFVLYSFYMLGIGLYAIPFWIVTGRDFLTEIGH